MPPDIHDRIERGALVVIGYGRTAEELELGRTLGVLPTEVVDEDGHRWLVAEFAVGSGVIV